jgi:hypothetical protein
MARCAASVESERVGKDLAVSPGNEKAPQRWGLILLVGGNTMTVLDPFAVSIIAGISIGLVAGWGTVWLFDWLRR